MKLIVPFSYYFPEQCAGLTIIDDILKACAEQGVESCLYVPTPTRNVPEGAQWQKDERMCNGLMHVHRFSMYGEGRNPLLRALRYVFCELAYVYKLILSEYDVIFLDSTPPIQGLKLPFVRLFKKRPVVHNVQDLFPDSLSGTGLAKRGGLLWKIGSWVSKVTFDNSDRIICISEDIKNNLVNEKGVPADKIEVVYNWVDESAVVPIAKEDNRLFEEFGICRNKFHVVYAGNLGNAQNIDVLIDAAHQLKDHADIEFLIFGTGGLKDEYVAKVEALQLHNVRFFPLQPIERVAQVYGLGDVCVVSCKPGLGGAAMPSKMLSIMSAGRAVAASFDKGELTHILECYKCGVYAPAGDAPAFAAMIKHLAYNMAECQAMGENARQLILQRFTKAYGTSRYVDIIKSVVR